LHYFFRGILADRAKQIKTKAMVNEDPTEKLIRDLKEENEKLKALLKSGKIDPSMISDTNGGKKPDQSKYIVFISLCLLN